SKRRRNKISSSVALLFGSSTSLKSFSVSPIFTTVTGKLHDDVLPSSSVTTTSTMVSPTGKTDPDLGVVVTVFLPSPPETLMVKETFVPDMSLDDCRTAFGQYIFMEFSGTIMSS